jgi:hypothetical protein
VSEFDDQVRVTATGEGTFAAELPAGWVVGGGVNGGFQLSVVASALRETFPTKPHALTMSAVYQTAGTPGPATVTVDVAREGGSTATASASLVQDGQTRISVLATCASLDAFAEKYAARGGPSYRFTDEPELAPLEECLSSLDAPAELKSFIPMLDRFELRLDPRHVTWQSETPSMGGEIVGWFRFADGRDPDPLALLTACDVLPPVTFDLGMFGWAPTLELSVHLRGVPAPGWLKIRHRTRLVEGGLFDEECEIWDSTGALVAQSRQLALVPRS